MSRRSWTIPLVVAAVALGAAGAWGEPPGAGPEVALHERIAPAIVNLRLTLRTEVEGMGEPEDSTDEVTGVLVDPSGLILVWNSHLSAGRMGEVLAAVSPDSDFRLRVTPIDIRVWIEGEAEEREAFLAASDSDLDLAFVQLSEPPGRELPVVDFSDAAELSVGSPLTVVGRLTSRFDRAPYYDTAAVTGRLRKPRSAWLVGAGNATRTGLPYFAADGRVAGVLVTFVSRSHDGDGSGSRRLFNELFTLGRGAHEVGPLGLFLLPAERVAERIGQARVQAARLLEERAAESAP